MLSYLGEVMSTEVSAIKKKTLRGKKKKHDPKVTIITFAYYPVRIFGPLIHLVLGNTED